MKEIINNIIDILEDLCMLLPPEKEHVKEKLYKTWIMLDELNNQPQE